MANSIAQKLRITSPCTLLTLHAPADFLKDLKGLPAGCKIITSGKNFHQLHWFVFNKTQLEKEVSKVLKLIKPGVVIWAYYPKASSKVQTDLTRDKGWDCLLKEKDTLTWLSLISFNDTWSVFGFRAKTDSDKKKETAAKPREIFNWVNPATKEIKLPDDLAVALKKNKKEAAYFNNLAFSHKKEYIEWIVTAKREETRNKRIAETIQLLSKQIKNRQNK